MIDFRKWSSNLAYVVGLIASDGCVSSGDRKYISITSKDKEIVRNFIIGLDINTKLSLYEGVRKNGGTYSFYYSRVGSIKLHDFLNSIGITPVKSKILKEIKVPDKYFADFIRGVFDGDGTFYTFWDKRWPASFAFQISFASASLDFINWLKIKLEGLYGVKGFIKKGSGVYNLCYVKRDSRRLFNVMYYKYGLLYLSRKYSKIVSAFEKDGILNNSRVRNRKEIATIAQW